MGRGVIEVKGSLTCPWKPQLRMRFSSIETKSCSGYENYLFLQMHGPFVEIFFGTLVHTSTKNNDNRSCPLIKKLIWNLAEMMD